MGAAIFISLPFSCYRRRPLLGTPRARHQFVKISGPGPLAASHPTHRVCSHAEHVHLLLSEPERVILESFAGAQARSLRACESALEIFYSALTLRFSPAPPDAPAFWQRRFYDFNVWSEKETEGEIGLHA